MTTTDDIAVDEGPFLRGLVTYNVSNDRDMAFLGQGYVTNVTDNVTGGPGDVMTGYNVTGTVTMITSPQEIPREMIFTDDSLVSVVTYSLLFFIAACGNLTVFITLFRNRHRRSRVNLFIMHLSIADMMVTFVMLPIEIGWHITVAWKAGDAACRLFMFFRVFGFYLSSFVLIGISLDRYFAILHPLSLTDADSRGKLMLVFAWLFSALASTPQVRTYLFISLF